MNKLERLEHLLEAYPVAGKRVLDAGTGVGVGTLALLRCGAASIVSVSIRASDRDQARRQFPELRDERVDFVCADLAELSMTPDADFDVCLADYLVTAIDALTPDRHPRVFAEVHRVLRPGGLLLATDAEPVASGSESGLLAELGQLWKDVNAQHGSIEYGSHPPEWVASLLGSGGFDVLERRWIGHEARDAMFVQANADGLQRLIQSIPEPARNGLESRRALLVDRLRAAAPLQGPRVFAVCARKPQSD